MRHLWLLAFLGCASETNTTDSNPTDASISTTEVTVKRTVCRGTAANNADRPFCAVPGVSPEKPPNVTCWTAHEGSWWSVPIVGTELVNGGVRCPPQYAGEDWMIVVLSPS